MNNLVIWYINLSQFKPMSLSGRCSEKLNYCYRRHPKDGESNVFTRVCPHPSWWGWVGNSSSQWGWGPYPLWQTGGKYPHLANGGYTHLANKGYPHLADGGYLHQDWMGYPMFRTGWWYPLPHQDRMGVLPTPPVRRQSSRASTCYVAGGMPLAFR